MTAIVTQQGEKFTVKYNVGDWMGTYTATSEADAREFAGDPERQREHRAFAVAKWRSANAR